MIWLPPEKRIVVPRRQLRKQGGFLLNPFRFGGGAGELNFGQTSYSFDGGYAVLSVERTGGTAGAASVSYATADGTATAGTHYVSASGALNWSDGEGGSKTIIIPVYFATGSSVSFTVELSGPSGAALGVDDEASVSLIDANYSDVVLLLRFAGMDASTTFTDEAGHTMTAVGNAQIDTAQSRFGGSSGLFDGSGDYVSAADSADWHFGSGALTVEGWMRPSSFTSAPGTGVNKAVVGQYDSSGANQRGWYFGVRSSNDAVNTGKPVFAYSTTGANVTNLIGDTAVALDTWSYVMFKRDGDDGELLLDNVSVGTFDLSGITFFNSSALLQVGALNYEIGGDNAYAGHIGLLRVTKGIAR